MKPTYHIVSHSHWDREWYKTFDQFRAMLVNMVDDLVELLRRDSRYAHFTLDGQTVVLDDYLAVRPEMEPELRRLVAEGRLIIGPWYVLPDEFLVSAEATVRNLLTGITRSRQFGGKMDVGYMPDSFGHIAMMPAIVRGFGIDTALVYRGFGGEPGERTSEYSWGSPDGSRVLMIHLFRHGYSAGYFHQESEEQILKRFAELKAEIDARATTSHRLLLNGGDHHWPDPALPDTLQLLRTHFDGEIIHSTVPAYAEAVKKEAKGLSRMDGELRFGYRYAFAVLSGIYSSRMYLKQKNWHCQNLLQRYVEPLNAWAVSCGMRTQLPLIRQAWKTLMLNHAHDSICGCSIDPVHREMLTRFRAVEDICRSVLDSALNHLIPYDDQAAGDDRYLFFVNPSPAVRSDVAAADIRFYRQDIIVGLNPDVSVSPRLPSVSGFELIDPLGKPARFQIVDRQEGYDITYTNYNYPRQTYADQFSLLVDAADLPPTGYKGFRVIRTDRFPKFSTTLKCGRNRIENRHVRVEAGARGTLTVTDKRTGEVFRELNLFESTGDVGDEYNYSYPRRDRRILSTFTRAKVKVTERGPLRAALRVDLTMRVPASATPDRKSRSTRTVPLRVTTIATLTENARLVTIETVVDNTAKDHRFRALFPSGVRTDTVFVDSQFSVLERKQKKYDLSKFTIEHPAAVAPMQRFVGVRKGNRGLTLFAYGLPEYELFADGRGTLALTLLRCVGLLAGEDLITRPGGKSGWHNETPDAQCPGRHSFRYAILTHTESDVVASGLLNEYAERFHLAPFPVRRKNPGELSLEGSFLDGLSGDVALSALKQAEDGGGIILRVYNTSGIAEEVAATFQRPVRAAWRSRLNEDPVQPLAVDGRGPLSVTVAPHEVVTIRCELDKQ